MDHPNCLRCGIIMFPGFIPDHTKGAIMQARWCPAEPAARGILSEVKRDQYAGSLKIETFRCPKCGYLESYAPGTPER